VYSALKLELDTLQIPVFTRNATYSITTETGFGSTALNQTIQLDVSGVAQAEYNAYIRDLRIMTYTGFAPILTENPFAVIAGVINSYAGYYAAISAYNDARAESGLSGAG